MARIQGTDDEDILSELHRGAQTQQVISAERAYLEPQCAQPLPQAVRRRRTSPAWAADYQHAALDQFSAFPMKDEILEGGCVTRCEHNRSRNSIRAQRKIRSAKTGGRDDDQRNDTAGRNFARNFPDWCRATKRSSNHELPDKVQHLHSNSRHGDTMNDDKQDENLREFCSERFSRRGTGRRRLSTLGFSTSQNAVESFGGRLVDATACVERRVRRRGFTRHQRSLSDDVEQVGDARFGNLRALREHAVDKDDEILQSCDQSPSGRFARRLWPGSRRQENCDGSSPLILHGVDDAPVISIGARGAFAGGNRETQSSPAFTVRSWCTSGQISDYDSIDRVCVESEHHDRTLVDCVEKPLEVGMSTSLSSGLLPEKHVCELADRISSGGSADACQPRAELPHVPGIFSHSCMESSSGNEFCATVQLTPLSSADTETSQHIMLMNERGARKLRHSVALEFPNAQALQERGSMRTSSAAMSSIEQLNAAHGSLDAVLCVSSASTSSASSSGSLPRSVANASARSPPEKLEAAQQPLSLENTSMLNSCHTTVELDVLIAEDLRGNDVFRYRYSEQRPRASMRDRARHDDMGQDMQESNPNLRDSHELGMSQSLCTSLNLRASDLSKDSLVAQIDQMSARIAQMESAHAEFCKNAAEREEEMQAELKKVFNQLQSLGFHQQRRYEDLKETYRENYNAVGLVDARLDDISAQLIERDVRHRRRIWNRLGWFAVDALAWFAWFIIWIFTFTYNVLTQYRRTMHCNWIR